LNSTEWFRLPLHGRKQRLRLNHGCGGLFCSVLLGFTRAFPPNPVVPASGQSHSSRAFATQGSLSVFTDCITEFNPECPSPDDREDTRDRPDPSDFRSAQPSADSRALRRLRFVQEAVFTVQVPEKRKNLQPTTHGTAGHRAALGAERLGAWPPRATARIERISARHCPRFDRTGSGGCGIR
jgi:hypothetical protein